MRCPRLECIECRLLLSAAPGAPAEWFGAYVAAEVSAAAACQPAQATVDWQGRSLAAVSDEWIVQLGASLLDGVGGFQQAVDWLVESAPPLELIRGLGSPGQLLVRAAGEFSSSLAQWLGGQQHVEYFEPNVVLSVSATPNDPEFARLWGLYNTGQAGGVVGADIGATRAWDTVTGSSEAVIAILDTGVDYNHPDLAANMWINSREIAGDGVDNDANGYVDDVHGWNFIARAGTPMDDNGHGTHVAGTIGAVANNGLGVAGVAWNVRLMPLKFLDAGGYGSTADAVAAINYATMMKRDYGVNVVAINNSWGGGGFSYATRTAIIAAGQQDILFVVAAGNAGSDNDTAPQYPASYDLENIIVVAATNRHDRLASFSNYGPTSVHLAAPGEAIYSTLPGGGYGWYSGTSMAAPHVSGAVALLWSLRDGVSAGEIRAALLQSVDQLPGLAGRVATGGRLNVHQAIIAMDTAGPRVMAIAPPPQAPPVDTITVRLTGGLDPASVTPASVLLTGAGADGTFNTADDRGFALTPGQLSLPQPSQIVVSLGEVLAPGAYRLVLRGAGSSPLVNTAGRALNDGSDEVYFFTVAPIGGQYEPNDSMTQAVDAGLAGTGSVLLSAAIGDGAHGDKDVDLFRLVVPQGASLLAEVQAARIDSSLDPHLRVFDAAGREVARNDDYIGLDSLVEMSGLDGGVYYIGVSGYGNWAYQADLAGSGAPGSVGPYALKVSMYVPTPPSSVAGTVWHDFTGDGAVSFAETPLGGREVFVDLDGDGARLTPTTVTIASSQALAISDFGTTVSALTVADVPGLLTRLTVTLNITHSYNADLRVSLIAPDGRRVVLLNRVGGSGRNFTGTVLDDQSPTYIRSAMAPFTGVFRPEQRLGDLCGVSPNGLWTLEIMDLARHDTGTLVSWWLGLTVAEPSAATDATGTYRLDNLPPGQIEVRQALPPGWQSTTPASLVVSAEPGQAVSSLDFGSRAQTACVLGMQVNAGGGQRSYLRWLTLAVDRQPAGLMQSALLLHNLTTGEWFSGASSPVSYDAESGRATWDLAGLPLSAGWYAVTAAGIDGGQFVAYVHVLPGDADGNGVVDVADMGVVAASLGRASNGGAGDLDGDGGVGDADVAMLRQFYGRSVGPLDAAMALAIQRGEHPGQPWASRPDVSLPVIIYPPSEVAAGDAAADGVASSPGAAPGRDAAGAHLDAPVAVPVDGLTDASATALAPASPTTPAESPSWLQGFQVSPPATSAGGEKLQDKADRPLGGDGVPWREFRSTAWRAEAQPATVEGDLLSLISSRWRLAA